MSSRVQCTDIPAEVALLLSSGRIKPLPPGKVSPFRLRVYAAACRIPRGRVATYRQLARRVGCGSPRAVGQALRHNPWAPQVPCHRVVATDPRTLGGFMGQTRGAETARKRQLLLDEGVKFDKHDRIETGCFYNFD